MSDDSGDERRENGGGGSGGNGGSGSGGNGGDQSSGPQDASTVEKVVMVVSVLFALSLVVYGGWQMAVTPEATTPNATVVGTDTTPSGDVAVTVRLRNPRDVGLVSATVQSDCTTPPPEVQFTYVPASTARQATLVCPPGTTAPNASVANWVPV